MRKWTNLRNRRFGALKVIEQTPEWQAGRQVCKCRCDCGKEVTVETSQLTRLNGSASCGCRPQIKNRFLVEGKRLGNLVVLVPTKGRRGGAVLWKCRCDCGEIAYISTRELFQGQNTCGCKIAYYLTRGGMLRPKDIPKALIKLVATKKKLIRVMANIKKPAV